MSFNHPEPFSVNASILPGCLNNRQALAETFQQIVGALFYSEAKGTTVDVDHFRGLVYVRDVEFFQNKQPNKFRHYQCVRRAPMKGG